MSKRPPKAAAGRPAKPAKKERDPEDPSSRFWERLIVDWVAVAVIAFGLQGLWFGFTNSWVSMSPEMKPSLVGISAQLGWPWLAAILAGLSWGLKRAWGARQEPARRR